MHSKDFGKDFLTFCFCVENPPLMDLIALVRMGVKDAVHAEA